MIKSIAYIIICVVYLFGLVGCGHAHSPTLKEKLEVIRVDTERYSSLLKRHNYIINHLEIIDTKIDSLCSDMRVKKFKSKEEMDKFFGEIADEVARKTDKELDFDEKAYLKEMKKLSDSLLED